MELSNEKQIGARVYVHEVKACPTCAQTFEGTGCKRYCSNVCRDKASYQRNGENIRARNRAQRAEKRANVASAR